MLFCLLVSFSLFSQDWDFEAPDYDKIEKNIQQKKSNLFYETLMKKYLQADATMTLQEKRHLYYGYTFQDEYSPYARSAYNDSLKVVLEKENHNPKDLDKILKFSDSILSANPFSIRALNYQSYVLEKMDRKKALNKKVTQLRIIIDVLISSGNGTSKEDAFYVIYTMHEYDLLAVLGFEFGGSQKLIEHYDYLTVLENNAGVKGLYFDVSPCLNSMLN